MNFCWLLNPAAFVLLSAWCSVELLFFHIRVYVCQHWASILFLFNHFYISGLEQLRRHLSWLFGLCIRRKELRNTTDGYTTVGFKTWNACSMPVTHRFRLRLTLSPLCSPVCLAFFFFFLSAVSGSSVLPALMKPFRNIDLNKSQRITNGNIPFSPWNTSCPSHGIKAPPLSLPNGMIVYWLSWHDPTHFTIWFTRRQQPYKFSTTVRDSPTLYRNLAAAITSAGGEPGSRRYGDMAAFFHWRARHDRLRGYKNRHAFRGSPTHRGRRSPQSQHRRWEQFVDARRTSRREYRSWKQLPGGNAGWANECFQPKPLLRPTHPATRSSKFDFTHPTPASKTAWYKQFVRSPSLVRNPPKVRHLKIASWNVEGLRGSLKYHLILQFMKTHHVDILLLQETHVVQTHTCIKDGFDFFFSGSLSAPHHGVGIVTAPSAHPYVSNFIGHDERIAQIDLHTSGHLTTLFSLYAPSTVPDPEDDLVRKESFWSKLDQIVTSHPKHKRFILAGDLNSRLHSGLDVAQEHIGPHHWGRPQSISDPQRDNAEYLHTFLMSHSCFLPQTFVPFAARKRITYKELTAPSNDLTAPDLQHWSALDYIIAPSSMCSQIFCLGSQSSISFGSRHFPILFRLHARPMTLAPFPSTRDPPLDFTVPHQFGSDLTRLLNKELDIPPPVLSPPSSTVRHIFTDGSCLSYDPPGPDNRAGWAFTVSPPVPCDLGLLQVTSFDIDSFGPFTRVPDHNIPPLPPPSNSTAELLALIEAFDWLVQQDDDSILYSVHTDSQYALGFLQGSSQPTTHHFLVEQLQLYWEAASTLFRVTVGHVPAHTGIPGNERADQLAAKGRSA